LEKTAMPNPVLASDVPAQKERSSVVPKRATSRRASSIRSRVLLCQLALIVAALLAWQFLPLIPGLAKLSHIFDPYFVSSPQAIGVKLADMFTGTHGSFLVWTYLWPTFFASIVGTAIGLLLGAAAGLILSNWEFSSRVLKPFIIAANATPRIALIPIVVIVAGTSLVSSVIIAVLVVFFVAFFNAYEGGSTVDAATLNNARLLGAGPTRILFHVRLPIVFAWTFAGLPLAVTFAVVTVVTGELLTGYPGMGSLIATAITTGQATLTWAVTIVLAVVGLVVVLLAEIVRSRVLHWWGK
jgi:NitT/TauT family transport system permease protein